MPPRRYVLYVPPLRHKTKTFTFKWDKEKENPDLCKECNTEGEMKLMACICPNCGKTIWGCQMKTLIKPGQFWRKNGKIYHIPRQEKNYGKNKWQVIRSEETKHGLMRWVFPREPEDEPIWSLSDFRKAELLENIEA